MKKKQIASLILALLLGAGVFASRAQIRTWLGATRSAAAQGAAAAAPHGAAQTQPSPAGRKILYWYDPMHPVYRSDKPGTAPDCGIQLVPQYADAGAMPMEMPAGTVRITAERQQLIGVKTDTARVERVQRTIRTTGKVAFDETTISHVHTKVSGYIEDVFADFAGKFVRKGDPLFTIYSPDLVATQQEYLIALRGQKSLGDAPYPELRQGAESLVRAAKERLRLWDVSEADIRALESSGTVKRTLTIHSPASGVVTERAVYQHGRYVTPETDLYTIANLSRIWVLADIFESEMPYVKAGQAALMRLSYAPGRTYAGRVTFVYPTLDPKTRTAQARLEFPNPGYALKPEMFADVELKVDYGTHVTAPQEAVLDAGTEQVVFVARGEGYFEPRKAETGPTVDGRTIILRGLRAGEKIVTSGNFLIDSESRWKSAANGMSH